MLPSTPSASEGILHETLNDEFISHGLRRIRVDWINAYSLSVLTSNRRRSAVK